MHRLSVEDVDRMLEAGILTEDDRVELLEGALVEMSPKSPPHTRVLTLLTRWLSPLVSAGLYDVRTEQPLVVPRSDSLPEPDLAVVPRDEALTAHPTSALLVVEVAVTSRAADTTIKPALYAAAGVPDCWVVDIPGRRLEVRRDPVGDEYRRLEILGPEGTVAPLRLDLAPLALAPVLAP